MGLFGNWGEPRNAKDLLRGLAAGKKVDGFAALDILVQASHSEQVAILAAAMGRKLLSQMVVEHPYSLLLAERLALVAERAGDNFGLQWTVVSGVLCRHDMRLIVESFLERCRTEDGSTAARAQSRLSKRPSTTAEAALQWATLIIAIGLHPAAALVETFADAGLLAAVVLDTSEENGTKPQILMIASKAVAAGGLK